MNARGLLAAVRLGVLLGLGGCTVGPSYSRPDVTLPETWRAGNDQRLAKQTARDNLWWKAFNDPTLDRLVDLAYQQNLPLQVAGLRIIEARARLGITTGLQFPQYQVAFGSAQWRGISENAANASRLPDRHFDDYQVGFDAAWEIDFWGKYRRAVDAERASMLATMADYYSALVALTAETARTYVVIRTFEVLIDQAQENARIQEDALAIANSRFKNGATSELDPTQAKTLLESTRATIPQLQISLQQARNALGTLLSQPPGTVEALLVGPKMIPKAPLKVAVDVPADMLRRRPDIRGAELSAIAQCARIGVAKADLYPSFTIFGTVGLETSTSKSGAHNGISVPDSISYTVGPRINWAFLNYGRITNAVRVEDARFQQLLVDYRQTVIKAAQEVEDALVGFLSSQESLVFSQGAVTSAQRSVELSVGQYREGAADYQRVLDAQRSLLQEEATATQTTSAIATNLIALYKALGGGWEVRDAPIVPERTQREMKERTSWGDMLSQPPAPKSRISEPQQ